MSGDVVLRHLESERRGLDASLRDRPKVHGAVRHKRDPRLRGPALTAASDGGGQEGESEEVTTTDHGELQ